MKNGLLFLCFFVGISCNLFGQYQNVTDAHNINVLYNGFLGGGVSFHDFNGDGWDDLTFSAGDGNTMQFYENVNGTFQSISTLVFSTTDSKHPIWVDYDNDGDKDLFVTGYLSQNRLYNNDGAMNLTDVTFASGILAASNPTFAASFGDLNSDGYLDFVVCNRATNSSGYNHIYMNDGDGTFTNISISGGITHDNSFTFSSSMFDADNDGDLDIYFAEDKYSFPNEFFRNNGDDTFTDMAGSNGTNASIDAMTSTYGDYDNDNDMDLFISNSGPCQLLQNNGGNYSNVAVAAGVDYNQFAWGANFLDFDLDMDLDLYVSSAPAPSTSSFNTLFHNQGNGTFTNPLYPTGFAGDDGDSYANAIGDFNNDGKPDIIVTNGLNSNLQNVDLLENISTSGNNYLKIKLEGVQSNRDGIGTKIEVWVDGIRQIRQTNCGTAFLAQNAGHEIFGLAAHTVADSVKLKWPSGELDVHYNVGANQTITMTEGTVILPVELVDFEAEAKAKSIELTWKTYNEINAAGYAVERSTDGRVFEEIAWLIADNRIFYEHEDEKTVANTPYYYRLKMENIDGTKAYSPVRQAILKTIKEPIILTPNPIQNGRLTILNATPEMTIRIYDLQGVLVLETSGTAPISIPEAWAGMYLVEVITASYSQTVRLLVY